MNLNNHNLENLNWNPVNASNFLQRQWSETQQHAVLNVNFKSINITKPMTELQTLLILIVDRDIFHMTQKFILFSID